MASNAIHFGTSGWRGIMADDFTFAEVRRAAAAIGDHLRSVTQHPLVLVGYDTRFFSEEFARTAADILRRRGCRVLFCEQAAPTPALAFDILRRGADAAVNITASHNPSEYNGIKFSGKDGGPALPEVTWDIERRAAALNTVMQQDPGQPEQDHDEEGLETINPGKAYRQRLGELVRFEKFGDSGFSLVCDAMHGCGAGYLDEILKAHGIDAELIRGNRDVLFDGQGPDPSEENLSPLRDRVKEKNAGVGLATDGDADRFGVVDRDGTFVSPNHVLALLFDYLLETRGWKLGAARSVATTHLIDAVAKLHDVPIFQTPVGFKYVGQLVKEDKIALGAEESAGMTIRGHIPEKDGILACLLTAEMIGVRGASLREQLEQLFRRAGSEFWPVRVNVRVSAEESAEIREKLRQGLSEFAGLRLRETDRTDGCKWVFEDGSWLLIRPSGTEPIVRVYAESSSPQNSRALAEAARQWVLA